MLKSEELKIDDIQRNLIISMAQRFSNTYLLYTACELELFDAIENEELDLLELSRKIGLSKELALRIIRPLIIYGLISERKNKYNLTNLGYMLTDKNDNSLVEYTLEAISKEKLKYNVYMEGEI